MEGPFYHFLLTLPIFALVLIFVVMPLLQWLSVRLFHRTFVLRLGGRWGKHDKRHRWDVIFSVVAFVLSLTISILALELLIRQGILPPMR
jgi:hypothetical protein